MIGNTFNQYHILNQLGEGGMGVVYLAEDTRLHRKVALKFISGAGYVDNEGRARFEREAQAAARLNHPNICTVYELGSDEQQAFIALEFVEGETLKERMRKGRISFDETRSWLKQIAEGLLVAHEQGVIHRDIKPANIMLTDRGLIKIMDFGIAKLSGVETELTQANSTIGTISYMSPEQALGENVDHRTDIWALGVILYELVTGKRPFDGAFREAVMYAMMHADLVPPSDLVPEVPEDLERIILSCLQREPVERYETLEELLRDLGEPVSTSNDSIKVSAPVNSTESIADAPTTIQAHTKQDRTKFSFASPHVLAIAGVIFIALLILMPGVRTSLTGLVGEDQAFPAMHLAVLPFEIVGEEPEDRALSDGIAFLVGANLMQIEQDQTDMWVVPVREVIGSDISSSSEARKQFGVQATVSGTIIRSPNLTQISFDLTDAKTLRVIRSERFEYQELDALALQDQVMQKLEGLLEIEIDSDTQQRLLAGSTQDPEAYKYYLQGQGYLQRYEIPENLDNAIQLFEQALEVDSSYALAHASLSIAYARKYTRTKDVQWAEEAKERSEFAIEQADTLGVVWVAAGRIRAFIGDREAALIAFEKAAELEPNNYGAYRGLCSSTLDFDDAVLFCNKAIELKPDYWDGYNLLGIKHFSEGQFEMALNQFLEVVKLTPDNSWGYSNVGTMYMRLQQAGKAKEYFLKALDILPRSSYYINIGLIDFQERSFNSAIEMYEEAIGLDSLNYSSWDGLGNANHWIGEEREAREAWSQALLVYQNHVEPVNPNNFYALLSASRSSAKLGDMQGAHEYLKRALDLNPESAVQFYYIVSAYELVDDRENALRVLEQALEYGYAVSSIENDPWLDELKKDDRYNALIERYQ